MWRLCSICNCHMLFSYKHLAAVCEPLHHVQRTRPLISAQCHQHCPSIGPHRAGTGPGLGHMPTFVLSNACYMHRPIGCGVSGNTMQMMRATSDGQHTSNQWLQRDATAALSTASSWWFGTTQIHAHILAVLLL